MGLERAEGDLPEHVVEQPLLSILLLEGLLPGRRGELEDALGGPARQEAEQVSEVAAGLDAVELTAGEQRDEGRVHIAAVVAAEEQPFESWLARVSASPMPRVGRSSSESSMRSLGRRPSSGRVWTSTN